MEGKKIGKQHEVQTEKERIILSETEGARVCVSAWACMGSNNVNSAREDREEAASQSLTCDELRH